MYKHLLLAPGNGAASYRPAVTSTGSWPMPLCLPIPGTGAPRGDLRPWSAVALSGRSLEATWLADQPRRDAVGSAGTVPRATADRPAGSGPGGDDGAAPRSHAAGFTLRAAQGKPGQRFPGASEDSVELGPACAYHLGFDYLKYIVR